MTSLKYLSLMALLFFTGCATEMHQKIKLDLPAYSPIKIEEYKELIFVPFFIMTESTRPSSASEQNPVKLELEKEKSETKAEQGPSREEQKKTISPIEVQREIMKYFVSEFSRRFKGEIRQETQALTSPEALRSPEYWISLVNNAQASLIFTGQANFKAEIRKAILYRSSPSRADQSEEDLFGPEKKLEARHVFTLDLQLALIKAATGEIVLERSFKETKMTPDLNYPAHFALYELMQRVKLILFRQIFGEERPQERYLLIK
ncbi:MAG: hypothetical protein N3B16_01035 [Candidatus Aminicenantes bacterium]|nr:hypothetical protein [Candidatus Aminicenantes bacterium]